MPRYRKGRPKPIDFYVDDNGCFICTSHHRDKDGYPKKKWDGTSKSLCRYIYIQMFGEIPEGLVVRHKCDVRACINPEHLELGTVQDNNNDRIKRDRTPRGEDIYCSKLNVNQVKAIKFLLKEGVSPSQISLDLNIKRKLIYDIKYNTTWKHVEII